MIQIRYHFISGLLLALLISPSAQAIRSVGNGGGLAEMRTIYLLQNVNRFLRICLTPANACQISNGTYVDWSNIYDEKQTSQNDYFVSFTVDQINDKGFELNAMDLRISHQMLYTGSKTPKSFGELLAFAISVKQDIIGSPFSFRYNLDVASSVFKDMKIDESNFKVTGIASLLNLSQLKVFDGVSQHLIMGLEDDIKTVNLSDSVTKVLPCGTLTEWSFNQWNSSVIGSFVYFHGIASAQCLGKSKANKILIKAALDSKGHIDENKISIGYYTNQ